MGRIRSLAKIRADSLSFHRKRTPTVQTTFIFDEKVKEGVPIYILNPRFREITNLIQFMGRSPLKFQEVVFLAKLKGCGLRDVKDAFPDYYSLILIPSPPTSFLFYKGGGIHKIAVQTEKQCS